MISNSDSGSDFIGRKLEMGQLTAALDNVLSGRGQIIMLAGERGIGKTRAANELAALADTKGFSVLRGWCYEHGGAPALWPWLQCIREYIETLDAGQLRREMGPGAADIAEILPELTAKLDGLGPPPPLDPAQARFRLFFSITTFFKNASQTQPMLLVLDDLHWADESSILLLEFLTKEIPGTSLMIVGTFRDGKISGRHLLSRTLGELVRERHFHRVHLEGLSREEVGEFIGSRSGIDVPQSAVNTLHERTGGNPLFVGEVVSSVSPEEIALNQDWVSAIPEAVRDAILRRSSGLSDSCNQLLLTASVMGSEFELSSLQQQASEIDEVAFPESLNEPLASRIIGPLGPGSGRYQFSHALIQQAVYQEIPPIKKAQAHAAMAESLEHLHRDSLVQHAGELAYHFAGAQKVLGSDKLVYFPLIVGEQAIEAFSHEQAMVHFNNVLAAKEGMAEDSVIAAARFGLGRAQTAVLPRHELGLAHENLSRAFEYYASAGNTAKIVAIAFEFYAPQLSEYGLRTGGLVEKALELVPADSLDTGRLHAYRGSILGLGQGDFQSARDSLDRTLIVARQEGNSALEIRALITSAQLESWNNHFEDGLAYGLTAIEKAVAASDLRGEVTARYWACLGSFSSGDTKETERQSSIFLESAGRLRDRNWGGGCP